MGEPENKIRLYCTDPRETALKIDNVSSWSYVPT